MKEIQLKVKPHNQEAVKHYDANQYQRPIGYTSDIALFTIVSEPLKKGERKPADRTLKIMLIKRTETNAEGLPNVDANKWALPGGFVRAFEKAEQAAMRELKEETNVDYLHLQHFGVYDNGEWDEKGNMIGRDDRGWIISNAFYGIVPEEHLKMRKAGDDANEVELFEYNHIDKLDLAFDHKHIIQDAFERIKEDMLTTTVAKNFLPKEFVLSELQKVLLTVTNAYNIKEPSVFFDKAPKLPFIEKVKDENGKLKKTKRTATKGTQLYQFNDVEVIKHIYQ